MLFTKRLSSEEFSNVVHTMKSVQFQLQQILKN